MRVNILCPHCEWSCTGRHSEQLTRVTKEIKVICTNPDCGHTVKMMIEAVKTLSPSAIPHPDVHLPLSKRAEKLLGENTQQSA